MRIPWPITIVAVLVTAAISIVGVLLGTVRTVPSGAAPPWWDYIANNAFRVALPTVIVGAIAWIVERNIRRSRGATDERRGIEVGRRDDDPPPAA